MLRARPLYDNEADARLFVEPAVMPALRRAVERGLNVMVTGRRGSGKTTLLRQLQRTLRDEGTRCAFVEASSVPSGGELALRIREAVRGRGAAVATGADTVAEASRAILEELHAAGEAEPTVVLVDASHSAQAVYDVFGRLRDVVWQFEHRWVVAIDEDDRATALKPPADAFFDTVLTLDALSATDLTRLLAARDGDASSELVRHVAEEAGGNPRVALRALGNALVHNTDPRRELDARARLQARANELGRPHGVLLAELLDRGAASASDDALQRSLGVTRARLSQLLGELQEQGLVVAGTERPNGPGRPRTVYRPSTPQA